jgi:hypothetical protein
LRRRQRGYDDHEWRRRSALRCKALWRRRRSANREGGGGVREYLLQQNLTFATAKQTP